MTGLIRRQLNGLAGAVADLKERVRAAVAGELARVVSGAVGQIVQAVAAGHPDVRPPAPSPASRPRPGGRSAAADDGWGRPRDPWDDDPDDDGYDRDDAGRRAGSGMAAGPPAESPPGPAGVTAAVAAAVYAARWWVVRQGTLLAAAGVGLGVGLVGVLGGPVVRTAVAVFAAAADLLAATDALGAGAGRLAHL